MTSSHTGPLVTETRGSIWQSISLVLGMAGSGAVGYGIARLANQDPQRFLLPAVIVGFLVAFISFFMNPWAWVMNPTAGLAAAGITLHRLGIDVLGEHLGFSALIVASVMIGPVLMMLLAVGGSRAAKKAADLVATGNRARAHVLGSRQTGIYVNERPSVLIEYTIQPLDGSPAFSYQKSRILDITDVVPRPGLVWPAWYDPADPSTVAIGAPDGSALDHTSVQLLREFGLAPIHAYGYDPLAGTSLT